MCRGGVDAVTEDLEAGALGRQVAFEAATRPLRVLGGVQERVGVGHEAEQPSRGIADPGDGAGAIMAHPDGCANIANRARAAGASEAEINEAVQVAYLFGGTPALVTATQALRTAT